MGCFSDDEMHHLSANDYVQSVSNSKIRYTKAFKEYFISEYTKGVKPTEIFKNAGFDTRVIGQKRIERAAARWRKNAGVEVITRKK